MKKTFLFILLATTLNLFAHFPIAVDTDESRGLISNVDFAPLQVGVGFFDKWQLYDGNAHSFVSVGILGLMQKSAVTSFAPINMLKKNYFLQSGFLASATEENYFFSFALFNATHKNYGLQLGAGNISASDWGIQVGLVNLGPQIQIGAYNFDGQIQIGILNSHGKIQIGLLNYNPKSYIPWLPFVNWDMGREEQ